MTFMTIDPGLGGTGYAIFDKQKSITPVEYGVLKPKVLGAYWKDRHDDILNQLADNILSREVDTYPKKVIIELPTMFLTNKGMACATGKDGGDSDLVKLSILVGRLTELFWGFQTEVEYLPVNEWKGTLSKGAVIARISERLKCSKDTFPDHAADAVGIGLYKLGVFKAQTYDRTGTRTVEEKPTAKR